MGAYLWWMIYVGMQMLVGWCIAQLLIYYG